MNKDANNETCEDCLSREGVTTYCPYLEEINGIEVEVILCSECLHDRAQEILEVKNERIKKYR